MIATHDFADLCAAIDARYDDALIPLADLLEEMGDPRAAGLRLVGDRRPAWTCPGGSILYWGWFFVPADIDGLPYQHELVWGAKTRSAAFLALAAALIEE